MQGNADRNGATPGELASIDESIEFAEYLDAGIENSRDLQSEAGRVYRVTTDLGNDLGKLAKATDELQAISQISDDTAGDMVAPVESAVAAFHADTRQPADIVELLIGHQTAMRGNCWQEDVEVMQAREQVGAEEQAVSRTTSYEDNLPGQLDEEIRSTQHEARALRMTDPADHDLERGAKEAEDEVPRASSRVNAAEDEFASARRNEDSARSALQEAETELDEARRESEAATAIRVNAARDEIAEARRSEDSARSALREAEWELDQARRESDGAGSSRVSAAEDEVAQAHWHIDSALSALREAESALDQARREADADGWLRGLEREHEDRRRQFEDAQNEHRSAEDRLHNARSALIAAQKAEVDTRREAESARQRNMRLLELDASRLDEQATGLISSRQGKLDRARNERLEAEGRLQQAQARRDSAVDAACRARREVARTAARMSDLDKIVDSVAECVKARQSLVAWATDTQPRCETLQSRASQSASLLEDDIAQTRREQSTEASAVSEVERKVANAEHQIEDVKSQIEGTLKRRRRRYRQIWFIGLSVLVLVSVSVQGISFFESNAGQILQLLAFLCVPTLHIFNWRHSRNRLSVLNSELGQSNAQLGNLHEELAVARRRAMDVDGNLMRLDAAVNCCEWIGSQMEPVERFCRGVTGMPDGLPDDVRMFDADAVMDRLQKLRSLEA